MPGNEIIVKETTLPPPGESISLLGEITCTQVEEAASPERWDTIEDVLRLERNYNALNYIKEQYSLPDLTPLQRALAPITNPMHGVDQISNQFATKILPAFMHPDAEEGLRVLRTIEPHTTDQEMVLLVNDDQFQQIHHGLREHLIAAEDMMAQQATERLDPKTGQISKNDRYQFNGNETTKSLKEILKNGVPIQIDPEKIGLIMTAKERGGSGPLPLTEMLKNERFLIINGFKDSKISLAVHDTMDHAWGFNLLRKSGLEDKYHAFLNSIGNPESTDIYKREGEIIASICFGVRYWATQENGFIPLVNAADIRTVMENYFDTCQLENHQMDAFRIIRSLTPGSREWQSLGFTYSNYIVELDQQRRKHGKIKVRDPKTHIIQGELAETDPDFLSLFIELHHEILSSKNKHRNDLLRLHILFEEYLQALSNGEIDSSTIFKVKVQELEQHSYLQTTVPPDRIRWMARNHGFSATKDALI